MRLRSIATGLISYIPGGNEWLIKRRKKNVQYADTANPRFCYSLWLRLLVNANGHLPRKSVPTTIAEIGPGSGLGIGIAALISGVEKYNALDVVNHTIGENSLVVFDELVAMFSARERIPDDEEFPNLFMPVNSYEFPSDILTNAILSEAMSDERLNRIRTELSNRIGNVASGKFINFVSPWWKDDVVEYGSLDLVFSRSVLEHVDDLLFTYQAMSKWLCKGGVMLHAIDFRSHGHTKEWNGHWKYGEFLWGIIRGNRPYLINREPHSKHIEFLKRFHFAILEDKVLRDVSGIRRNKLSPRFEYLTDDDLLISDVLLISKKAC